MTIPLGSQVAVITKKTPKQTKNPHTPLNSNLYILCGQEDWKWTLTSGLGRVGESLRIFKVENNDLQYEFTAIPLQCCK